MLFNSQQFLVFLPVVFILYWAVAAGPLRLQNLLLLAASWVFYGRWDPRFLALLVGSSVADWLLGLAIGRSTAPAARRAWLGLGLAVNLGVLGAFKYWDFFAGSISAATGLSLPLLQVVLPVGVSFYTFQSLGYLLDVHRRELEPERDPVIYLLFVAFFAQLVAGPIERAGRMLPQFRERRSFDAVAASAGLRRMLWGYVKKVVIADALAGPVAAVFAAPGAHDAASLWAAALGFAIQIYADFSGYADIALGSASLFGFRLSGNFERPYFAPGIAEFWRRWHVSLSGWFRDYVYRPLGRGPGAALATFLLSGLWHGANWTYVAWGAFHGLAFLGRKWIPAAATFPVVLVGWVLFRASSLGDAGLYYRGMAGLGVGSARLLPVLPLLLGVLALVAEELAARRKLDAAAWPRAARWVAYYALLAALLFLGNYENVPFIYFQF